jgi:tetratricopeptide (TPR) repeat protein/transglutaminase-like putative cysteine protease
LKLRNLTLLAALAFVAREAPAADERFHPELTRRLASLDRARGAEGYAALRRLWSTWDRANPTHVEQALLAAESDAKLAPPLRVYAGTLSAFARVRLGDFRNARDKFQRLGYVDRWLVVGPFANEGKEGLETPFGPETELTAPIVPGRPYTGKERPVRYRAVPREFPHGYLHLGALFRPERKVCGYATTFVKLPETEKQKRTGSVWIGSGGAFKAFWNGKTIGSSNVYSGHDFDRHAFSVELHPGVNALSVKVCGDEQPPVLSVRFADAKGAPDPSLQITNDVAESARAAELATRLKDEKPAKLPAVEGPVQVFERVQKKAKPSGAELEAYARYLYETDGDDPTVHKARGLAERAAEQEPTVDRLLLAANLAEDNNRAGDWIEKAEALEAKRAEPSLDVLRARALQRRSSPSFHEAFPLFERVLARDPDDGVAIRGRAELYNMAGLPRSALSTLERALERTPRSVTVLNLYASQLRALGRVAEAQEIESRYAALRFDDATFLSQMIDLAVARRDRPAAEHWAERMIGAHPGDLWALGAAARSHRALGQVERAEALYKRALELAPEDVGILRELAELEGQLGKHDSEMALLREVLKVRPQERSVREYLEHLEPQKPRPDEAYAWAAERFLPLRTAKAEGTTRRTLRDLTVSTVFDNGLSSKYRQVVFQPLTDAAAAQARQYAFAYEADSQIVQLRGAKVYRANGRVDEAIEWGEGPADDPSISMYTSARVFYVQFPRLEAGDVVELRYRIDDVTQRNEFNDYFGEMVYLQGSDPTANAEYVLITPKTRQFYFDHSVPGLKHSVREAGSQRIHSFFAPLVRELHPEPAMAPAPEVLDFIHVSTYKNWQDLGRWYWGLVKDQFDLDPETRKLAQKIVAGKTTEREKVEAVYDWVIQNTRYVALEFGIYGYKPRRCVQTVTRGWGDCKDKATVIVTLLNEIGIPATFIVVRTQMRGALPSKVASFAPFDHAIAYVPSLDLYLDGTAEHTGIEELPRMDVGATVLHVGPRGAELKTIPLPAPDKNYLDRRVQARVSKNGDAKLQLDYETAGYTAAEWRRRYHAESTRRERVNGDLGREFPGLELAGGAPGIVAEGLDDATKKPKLHVEGTAPSFARREDDLLSMAVTTGFRLTPNYASLSQRSEDVVILAFTELRDTYVVDLPPGSSVVAAPMPVKVDNPFGWYSIDVTTAGDKVTVKSRLGLRVARVKPKDYAAFKQFCAAADEALSRRLLVKP